jgi:Cupin-like domain
VRDYLIPNKPVLIKGGISHWPAVEKWNFDFFDSEYGDLEVPLGGIGNDILERRTFREYLANFDQYDDRDLEDLFNRQDVRYLRAFLTLNEDPEQDLRKRILKDLGDDWGLPQFMPQTLYMTPAVLENWEPSQLGVSRDDMGIGMFFSPKGAITELHQDCCQSDGFLSQIEGRKRAFLMSPDQSALVEDALKGRDPSDHGAFPQPRFGNAHTAFVADLEPGDLLYIPSLWIHEVYTLSRSISVCIHCIHALKAKYILDLGAKVTEHLSVCYLSDIAFGEGLLRISKALPIVEQIAEDRFQPELSSYGIDNPARLRDELLQGGQAMAQLLGTAPA